MTDLHFLSGYAEAYAREWNAELHWNGGAPYLIKPDGTLTHPYGYGGQVPAEGGRSIWWRCHPFFYAPDPDAVQHKEIVWIELFGDPEADLRKGNRSSVAAARRLGCTVRPTDDIPAFRAMYLATMARLGAADHWRISERLLGDLRDGLGRGFQILTAELDHGPEAACILLGAGDVSYYHYAASYRRHPASGAGNLLVVEAARWAKERGYARLHLGGGTTPAEDDPLLRFKAGFSNCRAWTFVLRRDL